MAKSRKLSSNEIAAAIAAQPQRRLQDLITNSLIVLFVCNKYISARAKAQICGSTPRVHWPECAALCQGHVGRQLWYTIMHYFSMPYVLLVEERWIYLCSAIFIVFTVYGLLAPTHWYTYQARELFTVLGYSSACTCGLIWTLFWPGSLSSFYLHIFDTEVSAHMFQALTYQLRFRTQLYMSLYQTLVALCSCVLVGSRYQRRMLPTAVLYMASGVFNTCAAYFLEAGMRRRLHVQCPSVTARDGKSANATASTMAAPACERNSPKVVQPRGSGAPNAAAASTQLSKGDGNPATAVNIHASITALQHILSEKGHHLAYRSPAPRTRMFAKISGFEPYDLPEGYAVRLRGSAASGGYHLANLTIRAGCIELMLEIMRHTPSMTSSSGANSVAIGSCLMPAILSSLKLEWSPGTKVGMLVGSQCRQLVFDGSDWHDDVLVGGPAASTCAPPAAVAPALRHVSPLCVSSEGRANNASGARTTWLLGPFALDVAGPVPLEVEAVVTQQGHFLESRVTHVGAPPYGAPQTAGGAPSEVAAGRVLLLEVYGWSRPAGLLRLELKSHGLLSGCHGVLVLPGDCLVDEVSQLEAEMQLAVDEQNGAVAEAINAIVCDLGIWLEFVDAFNQHEHKQHTLKDEMQMACRAPAYATAMLDMAIQLLAYCLRQGWVNMSEHIMQGILAVGCHHEAVADLVAASGDGLTLLHQAVSSGHLVAVQAVLRWDKELCVPASWTEQDQSGVTPLHFAAALSDQGSIAEFAVSTCPAAHRAWRSVRDQYNTTPAGIAAMKGVDVPSARLSFVRITMVAALRRVLVPGTLAHAAAFGFPGPGQEARYVQYVAKANFWCTLPPVTAVLIFAICFWHKLLAAKDTAPLLTSTIYVAGQSATCVAMLLFPAVYAVHAEHFHLCSFLMRSLSKGILTVKVLLGLMHGSDVLVFWQSNKDLLLEVVLCGVSEQMRLFKFVLVLPIDLLATFILYRVVRQMEPLWLTCLLLLLRCCSLLVLQGGRDWHMRCTFHRLEHRRAKAAATEGVMKRGVGSATCP